MKEQSIIGPVHRDSVTDVNGQLAKTTSDPGDALFNEVRLKTFFHPLFFDERFHPIIEKAHEMIHEVGKERAIMQTQGEINYYRYLIRDMYPFDEVKFNFCENEIKLLFIRLSAIKYLTFKL